MKAVINGEIRDYQTVWMEDDVVCLINQLLLPHRFEIYRSRGYMETADAIKNMIVRGAPAIGATASYGMAQAILEYDSEFNGFKAYLDEVREFFHQTRPTAYDLFHAVEHIYNKVIESSDIKDARQKATKESRRYAEESAAMCRRIGEIGEDLLENGMNILTHCNAGALACVDYGTALSPLRMAHYNKKKMHVYVDETRPRMQGSRLTAWELLQEGIDYSIIADNAAGYFMSKGEIDLVIIGADRIALNGDVVNKIGSYEKAVVARENNIPFYVAAPHSTIDFKCKSGKDIKIEERNREEVLGMLGFDRERKEVRKIRTSPGGSNARNPAFDVTPSEYITGIVTEEGIYKPDKIKKLRDNIRSILS
ncbi:MAG: S-methyl-5-thioribose-1-phosphate isomerase [Candidatus Altiarchaeales archaeon ex4484_2]|nr:MAG: S-methyl-5-thioribose-1-phosphate isomerase [Candidatus Altiarchaeales archaeon ex4484_2]